MSATTSAIVPPGIAADASMKVSTRPRGIGQLHRRPALKHHQRRRVNSDDDSATFFSSWGPTDDGRLKPDISAPGCQNDGDGGVTSTVVGGGYNTFCGTSMATPTATGVIALILQDYRLQFPVANDPHFLRRSKAAFWFKMPSM
ncbi:MAG: S8 family serine peptidase [Phycisphaerae bacterium]